MADQNQNAGQPDGGRTGAWLNAKLFRFMVVEISPRGIYRYRIVAKRCQVELGRLRKWAMNRRRFAALVTATGVLGAVGAALAASAPASWDGLNKVRSTKLQHVYLLPGADFRPYTKVMLDPTEVAFKKNWARDLNSRSIRGPSSRITDADVERTVEEGGKAASDIFSRAFAAGGFPVVTTPGPDVLRVRTAVVNLTVTAPDRMTSGRSSTYAGEAGTATLVVEARDSVSGALLARVVDPQVVGDSGIMINRTSVVNRADFRLQAERWAKATVSGLQQLRTTSAANP